MTITEPAVTDRLVTTFTRVVTVEYPWDESAPVARGARVTRVRFGYLWRDYEWVAENRLWPVYAGARRIKKDGTAYAEEQNVYAWFPEAVYRDLVEAHRPTTKIVWWEE
jgi:hypothetical protein